MFDSAKQFLVKIISGGERSALLRFPSDAEWCDRARRQKTIRRFLGRGKSESEEVGLETVNQQLFEAIRIPGDGPTETFDAADAGAFLEKLERTKVLDFERAGNRCRITMKVPGATVVHTVRIPTQREMQDHGRDSTSIIGGRRTQEIRAHLEPSGELYDKIVIAPECSGYASPVPIIHKVAVVAELLAQLSIADDDDDDPEV